MDDLFHRGRDPVTNGGARGDAAPNFSGGDVDPRDRNPQMGIGDGDPLASGSVDDGDARRRKNRVGLVPSREVERGIPAEEEHELRFRVLRSEFSQGVDGVGRAGASDLAIVNFETLVTRGSRARHGQADVRRCDDAVALMGRASGRNPENAGEAERVVRLAGQDQMPEVRWIKGPTQNAEAHPSRAERRPARLPLQGCWGSPGEDARVLDGPRRCTRAAYRCRPSRAGHPAPTTCR